MTTASRTGARKGSIRRRWVPPQHGVWAMLLLPYLAGLQYGFVWLHVPLLVVWIAGWLASYYALLALKTLRVRAVWRQVLVYGTVSGVAAIPLFVSRPQLLWFSPVFAVLLAMNAVSTRAGQERATGNGLVSVTMAALMAMIAPATAGLDWTLSIPVAVACWLYLAGTVFYVKTMIRERGSTLHYAFSVAFHVGAVAGAIAVSPWLALPFTLFLVRAALLPRWRLKVPVVGAIEVVHSVLLLGFLLALF
ncbi:YwiC-like family protein [Demequina sp.]|uniref:YwiC-like family protein n=1 Tax=Demequina sp. TaxID=2050685 RepID=UPI0025C49DB3|nr:YwiC-like family protein [Demequina sp.]